jgi:hydrogenase/urease accessory protein HupE
VAGGITVDEVTYRGHDTAEALVQRATNSPPDRHVGALGFLRMGVEHILTGYDHLVFLFGLVLVGGRLRSLVAVVTAFTVAHSMTLAIAVLGAWAPPSRVVEPLIALSIAYVGIENFFVKSAENRWRITFPFGLVHGFGFAGALREIALPRTEIPGALVCFNLGVEAGQLAVMAVALPVVLYLRKSSWFSLRGISALSGAVALAGVFWFLERVVHGG